MFKLMVHAQASLVGAANALPRREGGQTTAEYGVVLAVIFFAVVTAIMLISTRVHGAVDAAAGVLP